MNCSAILALLGWNGILADHRNPNASNKPDNENTFSLDAIIHLIYTSKGVETIALFYAKYNELEIVDLP